MQWLAYLVFLLGLLMLLWGQVLVKRARREQLFYHRYYKRLPPLPELSSAESIIIEGALAARGWKAELVGNDLLISRQVPKSVREIIRDASESVNQNQADDSMRDKYE
ncbi:MAG: hypothetical protein AB1489_20465 [Acidobacteriota bacterium]